MMARAGPVFILLALVPLHAATLIRDVNIVDLSAARIVPHQSVLIEGSEIRAVGIVRTPAKATVINGAGKYLMPGLWNMHVHVTEADLPLFLAAGVTGVRDMGGDMARTKAWRAAIQAGTLAGPRIITCGSPLAGRNTDDAKRPVLLARTPEEARRDYDLLEDQQMNFIAVLSSLSADAYFALLDRARKWGLPVAGEVPLGIATAQAIDSRQRSIEHLDGIVLGASPQEVPLRRQLMIPGHEHDPAPLARAVDTFDWRRADDLFAQMKLCGVWQTPMLTLLHRTDNERAYRLDEQIVARMQSAGVALLAGAGSGSSLHDELDLLVAAGLTPAEALRTATVNVARYFDADDTLGAIAPGYTADLVLLDANPLLNIRNARRVAAVFAAGRYLPRPFPNRSIPFDRSVP